MAEAPIEDDRRIIMETGLAARVARIVEPSIIELGYRLVRVKISAQNGCTLQIMAERPDTRQLNLSDCEALSRRVSEVLDEVDPIEEAYRLEVSSPGIDRPLTRLKDFTDWQGHEARIRLAEPLEGRKQFDATLSGVEGDKILIYVERVGEVAIPFGQIANAKLILTDALIKATAPISTEGADKIIETGVANDVDPAQTPQEG